MESQDNANQSENNATIERGENGHFLPGKAPKSPGRPPGSISIIGRIKEKFLEDPERFDEYVETIMKDKKLAANLMAHIDGAPKQTVAHEIPQSLLELITHAIPNTGASGTV